MEIIKIGKTKEELDNETEELLRKGMNNLLNNRVECSKCNSILKASEDDIKDKDTVAYIICPNCGNSIHGIFITMSKEKNG